MYNFFVKDEQINNNRVVITGDDVNHIFNVLRMKIGEKIIISNKEKKESYISEIIEINKDNIACIILEKSRKTESNIDITIFQGLPKSEKMEYIIQKATELGAKQIVPVEMKYCISKMKDENKKVARWQKIAEIAAKQSKRNEIPIVDNLSNINKICNIIKEFDLVIVAYENEEKLSIKEVFNENKLAKKIAVVIGPEGGFSMEEIEKLKSSGAKIVTLGNRILRTETAPIAILSMIMYEYEL